MAVTTDRDRERVNLVTIAYFSHCVLANKVQPWLRGCGAGFEPRHEPTSSNAEILQRYHLSTAGDILRHRCLSLFGHVAHQDPGYMMLCIWWWLPVPMKAESQWLAGEDHRATLTTSGSTMSRRMPTLYRCLCCGDLRSPGVKDRRNSPLGPCDDDVTNELVTTSWGATGQSLSEAPDVWAIVTREYTDIKMPMQNSEWFSWCKLLHVVLVYETARVVPRCLGQGSTGKRKVLGQGSDGNKDWTCKD